jgi:hypothetical protein
MIDTPREQASRRAGGRRGAAMQSFRDAIDEASGPRQVAVPASVKALCGLARVDYEDAFLVEIAATRERSAEQWVRALLEQAPLALRHSLRSGWLALGLKVTAAGAERSVLGWELRRSTPDFVVLAAGSRVGMPAELVFNRQPRALLLATLVEHQNPAVRAMWAGVEPVHRQVVPRILRRASEIACPTAAAGAIT